MVNDPSAESSSGSARNGSGSRRPQPERWQNKPKLSTKSQPEVYDITGADTSLSEDQSDRMKAYAWQMIIRTVCFIGAVIAPGIWRWILFLAAIFLPYIAVVKANNTRVVTTTTLSPITRPDRQLSGGSANNSAPQQPEIVSGEVISADQDADSDHDTDDEQAWSDTQKGQEES